jgi:hypothetical protein
MRENCGGPRNHLDQQLGVCCAKGAKPPQVHVGFWHEGDKRSSSLPSKLLEDESLRVSKSTLLIALPAVAAVDPSVPLSVGFGRRSLSLSRGFPAQNR